MAITAWNTIFQRDGKVFAEPHEAIPAIAQRMAETGGRTVLDIGSGTGRHVVFFTAQGFSVFGLDSSPVGLEMTRQWLAETGCSAQLGAQDIYDRLPYEDAFFDAVVSVQVIHHARIAPICSLIREIARVLKPGGLVFVTVPQFRNQGTRFEEVEPGTCIPLDGQEAGLPHHYFTPEELRREFAAFDRLDLQIDTVNHYCLTGVKRQTR